jgi:hypothetical protein
LLADSFVTAYPRIGAPTVLLANRCAAAYPRAFVAPAVLLADSFVTAYPRIAAPTALLADRCPAITRAHL